ncbi:CPm [Blackcurrant leafroll-associated virus 1]|uniref:CPm n=1 Tax=Blackcurrant leafroll-associated virus 1 TaxID=2292426 RepID=UPI000EB6B1F9|nr:CPm [Blackcurrant leafroll-associated virus 1]AYA58352.1 CPm [Blackcurrant leafroll-associated virus 1]
MELSRQFVYIIRTADYDFIEITRRSYLWTLTFERSKMSTGKPSLTLSDIGNVSVKLDKELNEKELAIVSAGLVKILTEEYKFKADDVLLHMYMIMPLLNRVSTSEKVVASQAGSGISYTLGGAEYALKEDILSKIADLVPRTGKNNLRLWARSRESMYLDVAFAQPDLFKCERSLKANAPNGFAWASADFLPGVDHRLTDEMRAAIVSCRKTLLKRSKEVNEIGHQLITLERLGVAS